MEDELHWLHILQDIGGSRQRRGAGHAGDGALCRADIHQCLSGAAFAYNRQHEILPEGDYVLIFTDAQRRLAAAEPLHLNGDTAEDVWFVFRYDADTRRFSGRFVTEEQYEKLERSGRLRLLSGSREL